MEFLQKSFGKNKTSKKSAFFNALSKIENKPQNMDYPFWCMQYFSAETKKENIVLDGINQKLKQQFLKHLTAHSSERFETFDLSALSLDELISAAQKYKTNFDISDKDTILHLQNLEDFTSRFLKILQADIRPIRRNLKSYATF